MNSALPLIHSLNREALQAAIGEMGQPRYRADQLWGWLYVSRTRTWSAMTNLPARFRDQLAERFVLEGATIREVLGRPGTPRKILVQLHDGEQVEAAIIPAAKRHTVCVSSQVGCRFGCAFCASGKAGWVRNLDTGEMVAQVLLAADVLDTCPSHVVFMGVGEPLDNYDAVLAAVRILNDHDGLDIGARRITISTCGIVPGIRRLADEGLQVELSVSLHAPTSELRAELMPVEQRYPLPLLLDTCHDYTIRTGRIITFEYTLIGGVNDSPEHADALARLLATLACRVNLIPLSPIPEYTDATVPSRAADTFIAALRRQGVNATLRHSQGAPLQAACGQLRIHHRPAS